MQTTSESSYPAGLTAHGVASHTQAEGWGDREHICSVFRWVEQVEDEHGATDGGGGGGGGGETWAAQRSAGWRARQAVEVKAGRDKLEVDRAAAVRSFMLCTVQHSAAVLSRSHCRSVSETVPRGPSQVHARIEQHAYRQAEARAKWSALLLLAVPAHLLPPRPPSLRCDRGRVAHAIHRRTPCDQVRPRGAGRAGAAGARGGAGGAAALGRAGGGGGRGGRCGA